MAGASTSTAVARGSRGATRSAWAREAVERGAGEVLLTSMDRDGTNDGYDIELTRAVADAVSVPVIASGGAGTLEHLSEAIADGGADAVLCASIFHYGTYRSTKRRSDGRRRHPGSALAQPPPRSSASAGDPAGAEDLEAGQFVGRARDSRSRGSRSSRRCSRPLPPQRSRCRRTDRPGSRSWPPGRRIRGAGSCASRRLLPSAGRRRAWSGRGGGSCARRAPNRRRSSLRRCWCRDRSLRP